jgi:hypothetical protein
MKTICISIIFGQGRKTIKEAKAHAAVSPRPPNPRSGVVARAEGYTYASRVRALSTVQLSVAPVP